ncbi:FKBP-type peptidyl-prolyl cis-trans isomerase [Arenicellales bacterium nBUS_48]
MNDLKAKLGDQVSIRYQIFDSEGGLLDGAQDPPEQITLGSGELPTLVESAILGSGEGDIERVSISAGDSAFGQHDPDRVQTLSLEQFSEIESTEIGALIEFELPGGEILVGVVASKTELGIQIDFNHPLIGRDCFYEVEVVSIGLTNKL